MVFRHKKWFFVSHTNFIGVSHNIAINAQRFLMLFQRNILLMKHKKGEQEINKEKLMDPLIIAYIIATMERLLTFFFL